MKKLLVILLSAAVCLAAEGKRRKAGPKRLVRTETVDTAANAALYDTIRPGAVRFSGYDKPNSSTRESFFITNLDSVDIAGVGFELQYFDMKGRMLHREQHSLMLDVPAGETRAAGVRSWDRNNAFHYYLSQPPLRRQSSPYKVKSTVGYVLRRH